MNMSSAVIIATMIATTIASIVAYCLDHARRAELQREYAALHDQVATLELRVRALEGGR